MKRISWILLLLISGCSGYGRIEPTMVGLHDQERAKVMNVAPFRVNLRLSDAAQSHAEWMAKNDKLQLKYRLTHTPNGESLSSRISKFNYKWSYLGENIAMGYETKEVAMKGWMASSGHKANILNKNFTDIGVGIAYDAKGQPWYCVVFGKPQ